MGWGRSELVRVLNARFSILGIYWQLSQTVIPMGDFEKLVDAAKRGNTADVTALAHLHPELINRRDELGATALHHAAFGGHRDMVQVLVEQGAEINALDSKFGATPAGWAIEYLREMGGFLAIELDDFAFAIRRGDVDWVARFLKRLPALRGARDIQGRPFKSLAQESGNLEIAKLFG
jgi:ankyrin repeat protein